jgi:hypothetical protein
MKSRVSDSGDSASLDGPAKPFRMITVFDSELSSTEASHASDLVLRELGDDVLVDKSAWNVALLKGASDCARAAIEAACADVILIALCDTTPSESLKAWIGQWEKERSLAGGLLALIPSGDSETGGDLAEFLYETAVSANMDFLCRKKRRY